MICSSKMNSGAPTTPFNDSELNTFWKGFETIWKGLELIFYEAFSFSH